MGVATNDGLLQVFGASVPEGFDFAEVFLHVVLFLLGFDPFSQLAGSQRALRLAGSGPL